MDPLKLATKFEALASGVSLKEYREELDPEPLEMALANALRDYAYEDVDVSYNDQHYGLYGTGMVTSMFKKT